MGWSRKGWLLRGWWFLLALNRGATPLKFRDATIRRLRPPQVQILVKLKCISHPSTHLSYKCLIHHRAGRAVLISS